MHKKAHTAAALALLAIGAVVVISAGCGESDDEPLLAAPSRLGAKPASDTQIRLNWLENANNEEGLRIYRDDGGTGFVEIGTVPANFIGYSDTSVITGAFHTYYVVAYLGAEESAHSNHVTMEAFAPYCDVITPRDGQTLWLGQMVDVGWLYNELSFDARITLSLDGGSTFPTPANLLQPSWTLGSPWPWKVGYKNTEPDPSIPPEWEQVVFSTSNQCKIRIYSYTGETPATGESVGTFTIVVP